jgi:hypothetical protein
VSIGLLPGLFVRIEPYKGNAPKPYPLDSGFSEGTAYRVLGVYTPSETAEAYLIMSNDRDELWFISNRHCRTTLVTEVPPGMPRYIRGIL